MAPKLVVKNTFLCAFDDDEARSPDAAEFPVRRVQTLPEPLPSSVEEAPDEGVVDAPDDAPEDGWRCRGDADAAATVASQLRRVLADPSEAQAVAEEFRGQVREAARSAEGHQVLLELIRCLSSEDVAFIPAELCGNGRYAANNIYGHTVVCRLLEFSPALPCTVELVDEVLESGAESLCCHKFGFSLAMSVVSNGLPRQRAQIVAALSTHVQRFARHRFASQVLEHALVAHFELDECQTLLAELMRHSGGVVKLACHCFGTHIVRALLVVPATAKQVRTSIMQAEQRLRKDRYGAKLLEDLAGNASGSLVGQASLFGA